jgi:hypothetical protein
MPVSRVCVTQQVIGLAGFEFHGAADHRHEVGARQFCPQQRHSLRGFAAAARATGRDEQQPLVAGCQLQAAGQGGLCLVQLVALFIQGGEVGPHVGIVRRQIYGAAIGRDGTHIVVATVQGDGQVVVDVRVIGCEAQGFMVDSDGLVHRARFLQSQSQIVEQVHAVLPGLLRCLVGADSLGMALGGGIDVAQ